MDCTFCGGNGSVYRCSEGGGPANVAMFRVTCPACIRGVTTLGTHELLRGKDRVHMPGERINGPTGTILSGLIKVENE